MKLLSSFTHPMYSTKCLKWHEKIMTGFSFLVAPLKNPKIIWRIMWHQTLSNMLCNLILSDDFLCLSLDPIAPVLVRFYLSIFLFAVTHASENKQQWLYCGFWTATKPTCVDATSFVNQCFPAWKRDRQKLYIKLSFADSASDTLPVPPAAVCAGVT